MIDIPLIVITSRQTEKGNKNDISKSNIKKRIPTI
jgi:hypothetical protein